MNSFKSKPAIWVGLVGIIISVGVLLFLFMQSNLSYYYSIEELQSIDTLQNKKIRITGAVLGDTIIIDYNTGTISFIAVHIPVSDEQIEEQGGIALVLHNATENESLPRLQIQYEGPMPDLLVNEAQIIAHGSMQENGIFIADELFLKCPSKYEDRIENNE